MKYVSLYWVFISFLFTSCLSLSKIKTIGIINNSKYNVKIETTPIIRYNGGPEKYIQIHTNDSIIWNFEPLEINAVIINPNKIKTLDSITSFPDYSTYRNDNFKAVYIMRPYSAFQIGMSDMKDNGKVLKLTSQEITISTLKIYLPNGDSLIANSKSEIWNLLVPNKLKTKKKLEGSKKNFNHYNFALIIE